MLHKNPQSLIYITCVFGTWSNKAPQKSGFYICVDPWASLNTNNVYFAVRIYIQEEPKDSSSSSFAAGVTSSHLSEWSVYTLMFSILLIVLYTCTCSVQVSFLLQYLSTQTITWLQNYLLAASLQMCELLKQMCALGLPRNHHYYLGH